MAVVPPRPSGPKLPAKDDVYTVLLIIAAVFVVAATVCLAYQFHAFYGLENLFQGAAAPGR